MSKGVCAAIVSSRKAYLAQLEIRETWRRIGQVSHPRLVWWSGDVGQVGGVPTSRHRPGDLVHVIVAVIVATDKVHPAPPGSADVLCEVSALPAIAGGGGLLWISLATEVRSVVFHNH